ncbi:Ger(x)C family spore germination protein [Priestia abyssalis]|uniref:Ger(x)C family spore germination protein n=1 Tax=Priestia abyssalis TaxID=1221450 RepID=UPI000995DE49|nr:Ger(x)C family spore germination protein [Priestia abyssalis]
MKSILLLLFCCGSILFVSGCWDRVELNDLAIVTAAAIDIKGEKEIELSLQIFIPKALSSGGGQGGGGGGGGSAGEGGITLVASQKGANIADALSKLQGEVPRKIFWGQCKVFIFGETLAKKGIQEPMDFLLRHPQPRERAYMYVSRGKAKHVLELTPELERYSGEVIRELSDLHIGMQVTMQDLDKMLIGKAQAAAIPYVKVLSAEQGQEKPFQFPKIDGTAVFKKDRMVGKINEKETRGVLWLRNEMEEYTVTVNPQDAKGDVSLNPVSAQIKLIPRIQGEKWKMLVKVNTEGAVVQNRTNLNLTNNEVIKKVEKAYGKDIQNRIDLAIQKAQHELKADILGFAKEFHRKYPKQWKQVENRWDEVFPEVEVKIDVEAHIRRQGYINKPGGLLEEEVKEK